MTASPVDRKFTMLDVMILIGAVALAIVGARDLLVEDFRGRWGQGVSVLAQLFLMLGSVSILVFRLQQPRPTLRQVAFQPGAVACFVVVFLAITNDLAWVLRLWQTGRTNDVGPIGEWVWLLFQLPDRRWACVVPIAWMVLILAGRWQPEAGWVDRSGRVLGFGWMVWGVAGWFL